MEEQEKSLEKRALYFLEESKTKVINYELNHLKNVVEKLIR